MTEVELRQQALTDALASRILVLDGAMGSLLLKRATIDDFGGPEFENCFENLVVTRPEWILDVHRQYFEAGADIVETDSFQGGPMVLAEFGLESQAHTMMVAAARLARQAADEF